MNISGWSSSAAWLLIGLAAMHSMLGEREVLRPLFRDRRWALPVGSRAQAEALLRFAWHLTTLAWWSLAAVLLDTPPALAFGLMALVSGALVFVMLRAHLAWPVFLAAGLTALHGEGLLPGAVAVALAVAAAALAAATSGLHLYWALGGRRGLVRAIPQRPDGRPAFSPGRAACGAVSLALAALAGSIIVASLQPTGHMALPRWLLVAALVVLGARVVGDGRFVGFTKRLRDTPFARADDQVFTPLVVLLWLGTASALALSH